MNPIIKRIEMIFPPWLVCESMNEYCILLDGDRGMLLSHIKKKFGR